MFRLPPEAKVHYHLYICIYIQKLVSTSLCPWVHRVQSPIPQEMYISSTQSISISQQLHIPILQWGLRFFFKKNFFVKNHKMCVGKKPAIPPWISMVVTSPVNWCFQLDLYIRHLKRSTESLQRFPPAMLVSWNGGTPTWMYIINIGTSD